MQLATEFLFKINRSVFLRATQSLRSGWAESPLHITGADLRLQTARQANLSTEQFTTILIYFNLTMATPAVFFFS